MSLVGAVSLTNKEGLFLGSVNLDNLNLNPNQIVYSSDGINMSGLNVGNGLQQVLNDLNTVGNPDIQLVSNSLYVNDNVGTTPIQTAVNLATQSDVIYISSGSYGEPQVNINNKYNIALQAPDVGNTITELINGIVINGTSELIRLSNLQIKQNSSSTQINGVGRQYFKNVVFSGTALLNHTIELGKNTTKYMTFMNCEFDQYCQIFISNLLSAPIYFINCNFGGATFNFANASPLLVIMSNCSGLISYPTALQATLVGLNTLTSGLSQVNTYDLKTTLINGSAYPPSSGVSVNNQLVNRVPYCTSTNNTLNCEAGYEYDETTNTLSVPNLSVTNINGNPPMSATSQAVNRIMTATATTNTLHSNQDATWNGTQLSLFNSNPLLIGRGNSGTADNTNLAVGKGLQSITIATGNTIIGSNSEVLTTQNNNTVVGSSNGANMTGAGTYSGLVLVGYNNTNVANTADGIAIGTNNTVGSAGIVIGKGSACGNSSIAIGSSAGGSSTNQFNTSIGGNAGKFLSTGVNNVHLGYGAGSTTSGNYNCMIGSSTGSFAGTQSYNVVVGYNSTSGTGGNNTVVGYNSSVGIAGYTNCSILGQGVTGVIVNPNEIQIGNSATTVYTYATATRASDMRDKAEIRDTQFGLEFISKLKPRDYKFDYRDDYRELKEIKDEEGNVIDYEYIEYPKDGSKKRNRFHCGLIAQEVKEVMDELNTDFAGYIDFNYNKETLNKGELERLTVKYDELICPLIKAVQELKLKNEQLEERIKVLESK